MYFARRFGLALILGLVMTQRGIADDRLTYDEFLKQQEAARWAQVQQQSRQLNQGIDGYAAERELAYGDPTAIPADSRRRAMEEMTLRISQQQTERDRERFFWSIGIVVAIGAICLLMALGAWLTAPDGTQCGLDISVEKPVTHLENKS